MNFVTETFMSKQKVGQAYMSTGPEKEHLVTFQLAKWEENLYDRVPMTDWNTRGCF